MINNLKRNKAFTLIELIVVIAVIGILALLAAPKFLGHTEDARLTQIKSDIVSYERAVETKRISLEEKDDSEDPFISDRLKIEKSTLVGYANSEELYHKGSIAIEGDLTEDDYYRIEDNLVNSKLKGTFFMDKGGKVFYHDSKVNDESGDEVEGATLLTDDDFEFVTYSSSPNSYVINGKSTKGHFHYKGQYDKVIIPHEIMGNEVKDYYRMFYYNGDQSFKVGTTAGDNGTAVTEVISDNPNVTNMKWMFGYLNSESIDLSNFDTSNVTDMSYMFRSSKSISIDVSNFDTSKVTNMRSMFVGTLPESLDLKSFDTSNVTDMNNMFGISRAKTLDLSNFDTSNVTDMSYMFYSSKLISIDVSNFDTSKVTNMRSMFSYAMATSVDLSSFNTSKVTNMNQMFYFSRVSTLDLSSFDTSNVAWMKQMFQNSITSSIKAKDETNGLKLIEGGKASSTVVTWPGK